MNKKYQLLMVGTDAEVFLRNKYTKEPTPVIGLLGGTKWAPQAIKGMGKGYAVQEDNVMAEFNIPPAWSAPEFSKSIQSVLDHLTDVMKGHNLDLAIAGSMHFAMDKLRHPQAQTFGCEPDINAWLLKENSINMMNPLLHTMRTAAAHIHLSYLVNNEVPSTMFDRSMAARAQDLFIGVPSLFLDKDKERREIYGKAGAFRKTDYGHEYRTVSNFWIASEEYRQWVFKNSAEALDFVSTNSAHYLAGDSDTAQMIQDAINNFDLGIADYLIHEFSIPMPQNVNQ